MGSTLVINYISYIKEEPVRKMTSQYILFARALRDTDIKLMKELYVKPPPNKLIKILSEEAIDAVKDGRLDIIKFLHQNQYELVDFEGFRGEGATPGELAITAVKHGHFNILKYIVQTGGKIGAIGYGPERILHTAARYGRLRMMKYLRSKNCEWSTETCWQTMKYGHFNVLKYLHKNGCPWNELTCEYACKHNRIKMLKYAHERGCPWDAKAYNVAVNKGRVECVKYLISKTAIPKQAIPALIVISNKRKQNADRDLETANLFEEISKMLRNELPSQARRIGNKQNPKCKDSDCAICHEPLFDGKKGGYGQLDCSHCFHVDCLFQWYDLGNTTCPMCRAKFVEHSEEMLRGGSKIKKVVKKAVKK